MTVIANPIYDAVFKFLMEDKEVAKILLSALLKKEIIDLEMHRHERTSMEQTRIFSLRIDFSAKVREKDGAEHLIIIKLQKTRSKVTAYSRLPKRCAPTSLRTCSAPTRRRV